MLEDKNYKNLIRNKHHLMYLLDLNLAKEILPDKDNQLKSESLKNDLLAKLFQNKK